MNPNHIRDLAAQAGFLRLAGRIESPYISGTDLSHELERFAALIEAAAQPASQEPLTWYEGYPPFPQDQEWFIAETVFGDRVVLTSLDSGRKHNGNYAFKTADGTYMKAESIRRWMQFPDCEFLPPEAD